MALFAYNPRSPDFFDVLEDLAVGPYAHAASRDPRRNLIGSLASFGNDCQVHNTDKEYRVNLDLQHYTPEEVKITSDDKRITINAKHEEKQDNHGFVRREITRVFTLPEGTDARSVTSTMNSRGGLTVRVQKEATEAQKEISIPVEFTGKK